MKYIALTGCMALVLLFACNKEENFLTDQSVMLEFSLDTLRFDTVFTRLGSATRSFKVYNRNKRPIRISRVHLENGTASKFRMNVDGIPGEAVEEVEVYGNDSIYVFMEVTIDPDQPLSISPFIIEEKVVFETNGNQQEIQLEAWGQNANYFPSRFNKGVPVILTCDNSTIIWDDPKPYVIYGEILIDSCALEIAAGAKVYVHGGIARNDLLGVFNDGILYTLQNGSIRISGTAENPVIIQGDRLEEGYQEVSDQWYGIIIGRGSKGNSVSYATIKNSRIGFLVDSTAELSLANTQIYNTAASGITGFHSTISAENCLVYNNGGSSVQLIQGGDYQFEYCTVASYGVDASAISMNNFFCYDDPFQCQERKVYRLNAEFTNCIFYGSRADELQFADISGGQTAGLFNVKMDNCIVRIKDLLTQQDGLYANFFQDTCTDCLNPDRDQPLFIDANEDDYHLDTLSVAIGKAQIIPGISIDLEGMARDNEPDIGAYEY